MQVPISVPATQPGVRTLLLRYAAIALGVLGGLEWLLGRTISRIAASPTLDGTPRDIIEELGRKGIFVLPVALIAAATILFLSAIGISERSARERSHGDIALGMYLSIFGTLTVVAYFFPTTSWLATSFTLMSLIAISWVYVHALRSHTLPRPALIAVSVTMLAYLGWFYYIIEEELSARLGWEGAPVLVLNLGEIVALLAPFAFFAAMAVPNGQWRHYRRWILPVLAALLVAGGNVADMVFDQGLTGVFTLWSTGFTNFLPWPLYSVALALYGYAALTCFSRDTKKPGFANPNTGLGLLLLLFAGYNLQLTYQHLVALLAMMLFTGLAQPFAGREEKSEAPLTQPLAPTSGWKGIQEQ